MACSMPPMYWSTGIQWRGDLLVEGCIGRPRVGEPQEVPGRVHEGVHRVGLAGGRAAAHRAGGVAEIRVGGQRRLAGGQELDVVRGEHGQLVVGDGHDAVVGAVDDGDRAAPEPLARDQPVPQAVVDLPDADALLLEPLGGPLLGRRDVETVQPRTVDLLAGPVYAPPGPPSGPPCSSHPSGGSDRAHEGQAVGLGEVPVPGVLGRDGHDGAGPVAHQHVVGHVDGHGRPR